MRQRQVNSLNLPAGSSSAFSGIMLETQYRAKSPFCAVVSSARVEVHSATLPIACSVGFAAPRIFLIPTFLCSAAQRFHSFPLFVSSQEQRLQSALGHLPTEARLMCLFFGICHDFLAQKPSLPLHHMPCSHLQNRATLFGKYWCLWKNIVIFLCGLCVLILLILQISQGFPPSAPK